MTKRSALRIADDIGRSQSAKRLRETTLQPQRTLGASMSTDELRNRMLTLNESNEIFSKFIQQESMQFRSSLISQLRTKVRVMSAEIMSNIVLQKHMAEKVPILYDVYVSTNRVFGIIDFLVHSNSIHLFGITNTNQFTTPYVPILYSFSSLPFAIDGISILNTPEMRYLKLKLYLLTESRIGFILGRNGVGKVDLNQEKGLDGLFIKLLKNEPEPVTDLRIWQCGIKHRKNAIAQSVLNWRDPRCNAKLLGISSSHSKAVDNILEINRQDEKTICPSIISTTLYSWRFKDSQEAFLDIETVNLPEVRIFLIGLFTESSGYIPMTADELSHTEERRLLTDALVILSSYKKIWYWHAEKSILISACKRHNIDSSVIDNLPFADMYQLFISEPIVLQGCFSFGLKEISKTMVKHGMIADCWSADAECVSGMDAIVQAIHYYREKKRTICESVHKRLRNEFEKIIDYNRMDCEVLHRILTYLRSCH